jgi:hypothetical protein
MCVIVWCKDRPLAADELKAAWEANPDGAGLAWAEAGSVQIRKGFMTLRELERFYKRFARDFKPHVIHFRLATSGWECPELCHPFLVAPDSPLVTDGAVNVPVLFHNGHWGGLTYSDEALAAVRRFAGPYSDSRVLAALAARGRLPKPTTYGKVAILRPSGRMKLIGDGWLRDGGLVCSNSSYKPLPKATASRKRHMGDWEAWECGGGLWEAALRPALALPGRRPATETCKLCWRSWPVGDLLEVIVDGNRMKRHVCRPCVEEVIDAFLKQEERRRHVAGQDCR